MGAHCPDWPAARQGTSSGGGQRCSCSNTKAIGRTAKHQAWAAQLTAGQHPHLRAQLLPTAGISQQELDQAAPPNPAAANPGPGCKRWARRQLRGAAWRLTRAPRPPWRMSTRFPLLPAAPAAHRPANAALAQATDQHQHCAPAAPITTAAHQARHQPQAQQQHQQHGRLP